MKFLKREFITIFCFLFCVPFALQSRFIFLVEPEKDYSIFKLILMQDLKELRVQLSLATFCALQADFDQGVDYLKGEIDNRIDMKKIVKRQKRTYKRLVEGAFEKYISQPEDFEIPLEICFEELNFDSVDDEMDYAQVFIKRKINLPNNVETLYLLLHSLDWVDYHLNCLEQPNIFPFEVITQSLLFNLFNLSLILQNNAFSDATFSLFTVFFKEIEFTAEESSLLNLVKNNFNYVLTIEPFLINIKTLLNINKKLLKPIVEYYKDVSSLAGCIELCKSSHVKQILNFSPTVFEWGEKYLREFMLKKQLFFQHFLTKKLKEDLLTGLMPAFANLNTNLFSFWHIRFNTCARDLAFDQIYNLFNKEYIIE